jgi:hypothetical protein
VIHTPIVLILDHVAALLRQGHVDRAEQYLAAVRLPSISPSGVVLMRAIGYRLGIGVPAVPKRCEGGIASLIPVVAEKIAMAFDGGRDQMRRLEKLFIPRSRWRGADALKVDWDSAKHPREGDGRNPGWFAIVGREQSATAADTSGAGMAPIPVQDFSGGFHDVVVDAWVAEFKSRGIPVVEAPAIRVIGADSKVVGFPDMIIQRPGEPIEVVEVKTGSDPPLTPNQRQYLPMLQIGGHIYSLDPRIRALGLTPGVPFSPVRVVILFAPGPGLPYDAFRLPLPKIIH